MEKMKQRGLRKPRNPYVKEMLARSGSGAAGKHANREREIAKGWRRHPKHRQRGVEVW